MTQLVEFPMEGGETILVEVTDTSAPATRGLRPTSPTQIGEHAHKTFEAAVDRIGPVAHTLVSHIRMLDDPPNVVHIEFGLDMHAEAGAFIAAASAGANFKIALTWHSDRPVTHNGPGG